MKPRIYTELYALVLKDTKEILTPDSFKKYWKNYGSNQLHGWRPAKKIYYTLGTAKAGFNHIPESIKPQVSIAIFSFDRFEYDGSLLVEHQRVKKEKKEAERKERWAKQDLERAERELRQAKEKLEMLKNKKP
jgi:hypothetical protein